MEELSEDLTYLLFEECTKSLHILVTDRYVYDIYKDMNTDRYKYFNFANGAEEMYKNYYCLNYNNAIMKIYKK